MQRYNEVVYWNSWKKTDVNVRHRVDRFARYSAYIEHL